MTSDGEVVVMTSQIAEPEKRKRKLIESEAEESEEEEMSSSDESDDSSPKKQKKKKRAKSDKDRNLWKLAKGKYLFIISLCKNCQDNLYKSKTKVVRSGKKVELKYTLCKKCVKTNIEGTDIYSPYIPK